MYESYYDHSLRETIDRHLLDGIPATSVALTVACRLPEQLQLSCCAIVKHLMLSEGLRALHAGCL